jgi:hypothetical protein
MNDLPGSRTGPERGAADPPGGAATTTRLGGGGRRAAVVGALIAIFVAVALVKPWPGPGAPRPTPRATVTPIAVQTIDPLAELRLHCQEPPGWRVYSQELWSTLTVRSWRSLEPAYHASGPLDPAIPIVPLGARIDALGYCSPWTPDQRPPDTARVDAWRIGAPGRDADRGHFGAPVAAAALSLQPLEASWPSVLGALYGPPVDRVNEDGGASAAWPDGRFVFAVRAPGYERWWAVDVEAPTFRPGSRPDASSGAASP